MSLKLLSRDYKTLKIIRILFISTIHTRNKMANKIHENQFNFVANAQLFDNPEHTSLLLFRFPSKSSDILTKQLQFLLMIIANTNSETPTIYCRLKFGRKYRFS